MHVQCTCRTCGATFQARADQFARGRGVLCSTACRDAEQRQRIPRICLRCGGAFTAIASEVNRGKAKYCSAACYRHPSARLANSFSTGIDRADPDGCWPWMRCRTVDGYGSLRNGTATMLAHRFAWEQANGPIPPGMDVCHRCDNPPCCRPDHLFLGSHAENMADMKRKGRRKRHAYASER